MAKETKAQRMEREVAQAALLAAEQAATYLLRVMEMLQRAQKVNFELKVVDQVFELYDRDARKYEVVQLDPVYSKWNNEQLEEFGWEVSRKEDAELEADRKFQAKQVALSKLTAEEKSLLNLE